jgi:uncharacterized membrane protein
MHRLSYKILLSVTILATLGGLFTLIPVTTASYPNILGYSSLCTYTPAATLFCFLIAGTTCFIRSTFIKDQSGSIKERIKKHRHSFISLLLILILALTAAFRISAVKQKYTDSASAVTEISGGNN